MTMGMERTWAFLNASFKDYYAKHALPPPMGFQQREFGFMYHNETFFRRHLGFPSPDLLKLDIVRKPPAHVYHSAAYYDHPSAHTMAEKGWVGADLIFDLDADHLEGADKMSYGEMLAAVKVKFVTLIDNFLGDELGYAEKDLHLVFSGSRGYHCHVRDSRVRQLSSPMRREVVDFVTGKVEVDEFVRDLTVEGKFGRPLRSTRIPGGTEGGWGGKLTRATVEHLRGIAADSRPATEKAKALSELTQIGPREAKALVEALEGSPDAVAKRIAAVSDGVADIHQGVGPGTFRHLFAYHLNRLKGWCDEPVSSDVKRLIRAPGSLHGKTGLRATPLTRDKLDDFDPLVEAVALGDELVKVSASPTAKPFTLKGQEFKPSPGPQTLPLYAAVFLILRRQALLEGDTPPAPPPLKPAPAATGGTA